MAAVEVVAIGTELLLGDTLESNGAWLGRVLGAEGIRVVRRTIVDDDASAIRQAVAAALERTGIVVCSGGLGPTRDDVTKPAIAELYGVPLRQDAAWLEVVRERFRERGLVMPAASEGQALVPEGATFFPNAHGTAPGLALEDARGITILLPGVPTEFRGLVNDHVRAWLLERVPDLANPIVSRVVRTTGVAESAVAERIEDLDTELAPLTLASLPSLRGTDLRITSWGVLPAREAEAALERAEHLLRERLGSAVYGGGVQELAAGVGHALDARGLTLAVAESCTGGLVTTWLTDEPGASRFLLAGFVTYADEAKRRFLGVPDATLVAHGAVSEATVRAMAEGAQRETGADAAVAVTGIAGPAGGTAEKPVGTVWIAARVAKSTHVRRLRLAGSRTEIRERAAQAALDLLRRTLPAERIGEG